MVNRKGGTGKTTSAAYIAQALSHINSVTGIDLDEDASWLKLQAMGGLNYKVLRGDKDELKQQVAGLTGFVVIDTPPNDESIIYKVSAIANEVIVPLAPTILDLGRLKTTLATIADVEEMRKMPLTSVLLTKWKDNLLVSKETFQALEERKVPILDNRIRDLARYKRSKDLEYLDEYEAVLKELEVI